MIMSKTSLMDLAGAAMDAPNRRVAASWTNDQGETLVVVVAMDSATVKAGSELATLLDPLDQRDGVVLQPIEASRIVTDTRSVGTKPMFDVVRGGKQ
jgi:hypothetical protein